MSSPCHFICFYLPIHGSLRLSVRLCLFECLSACPSVASLFFFHSKSDKQTKRLAPMIAERKRALRAERMTSGGDTSGLVRPARLLWSDCVNTQPSLPPSDARLTRSLQRKQLRLRGLSHLSYQCTPSLLGTRNQRSSKPQKNRRKKKKKKSGYYSNDIIPIACSSYIHKIYQTSTKRVHRTSCSNIISVFIIVTPLYLLLQAVTSIHQSP